ncbi:MAG TPA: MBOAT family O-acyltransferase [bacterium]|nr:MBOAT family O-acyltransferase [bacterium]HPN45673.1 MBOAT family O-acyltransferase [bacterium]
MLFNSSTFFIFLPIVFILYWFVTNRHLRMQNFLVLVASYVFYGWWDWRFLSLVIFSSLVDYFIGRRLQHTEQTAKRKFLLLVSLLINLGLLGTFKYFNFFVESWNSAWQTLGVHMNLSTLKIILPVGISFYTFQTLSYTIDVYRKRMEPTRDIIAFLAFVSFFPQLVAGPIERASNLLPQFFKKRHINSQDLIFGSRKILWGLFKKVVVADNMSPYIEQVFNNPGHYQGMTIFFAVIFFAIQIYCDFSGYSDIAIGTARYFGFTLMTNFRMPYFSRSIKEFWSRWHISLSTWFRDYVYIPLGGNRGSLAKWQRNLLITFVVSGFWHGANWTFLLWGFIHGFFNSLEALATRFNVNILKSSGILAIFYTFIVVCFSWIFFRAASMHDALIIIQSSLQPVFMPAFILGPYRFLVTVFIALVIFSIEFGYQFNSVRQIYHTQRWYRWAFDYSLVIMIILFGQATSSEFIYFQF